MAYCVSVWYVNSFRTIVFPREAGRAGTGWFCLMRVKDSIVYYMLVDQKAITRLEEWSVDSPYASIK